MRICFKFLTMIIASLSVLWTSGIAAPRRVSAPTPAVQIDADILGKILEASGIEDRARYAAAYRNAVSQVVQRVGAGRSQRRLARRIFHELREDYFRHYNPDADGFDSILTQGEYNCLSASLFFGLVLRGLGVETKIVEAPFHLFVRLELDGRWVDVETTARRGFDLQHGHQRPQLSEPASGFGREVNVDQWSTRRRPIHDTEISTVDLERAVAFVWHNRGNRALERGEALEAARSYWEESKLRPDLTSRSEVLASHLARAFRQEYEAGRFAAAHEIADISLRIFPGHTSAKDRLLAVALKRIEQSCGENDAAEAERLLDLTVAAIRNPEDVGRLERVACPLISMAAVRLQDWGLARRMSARFAGSQPDPGEAARLAAWVGQRERDTQEAARRLACPDIDAPVLTLGPAGVILMVDPPASGEDAVAAAIQTGIQSIPYQATPKQ